MGKKKSGTSDNDRVPRVVGGKWLRVFDSNEDEITMLRIDTITGIQARDKGSCIDTSSDGFSFVVVDNYTPDDLVKIIEDDAFHRAVEDVLKEV